jgi:hypothetical protein
MSMKIKLFGALGAVVLVATATALPAGADQYSNDSTPGFTVSAGVGPRFDDTYADETAQSVFPTVGNFGNVTLNGTPQLTSAVIAPFTVIDDSGDGTGWRVELTVPDFSDGGTNAVDAAGASMNPPVIRAGTSGSALGGVWASGWTDFEAARKIVHADPADLTHNGGAPTVDGVTVAGMGTYLISPQILKLVVPVNTHAAAYTTTATISVTQTP